MQFVAIGRTEIILALMFPSRYDAHVDTWRQWRALYRHGIVDKGGVILVGRLKGQKCL